MCVLGLAVGVALLGAVVGDALGLTVGVSVERSVWHTVHHVCVSTRPTPFCALPPSRSSLRVMAAVKGI